MVAKKPEAALRWAWHWPWVALWVWCGAWALAFALRAIHAPWWLSVGLPTLLAALMACWPRHGLILCRRLWVAAGFPLSVAMLASGGAASPAWWLLPLGVLLLVYPLSAWRDAPILPTPAQALSRLATHLPLGPGARILDAGCGMGHALQALRRAYPEARLTGVERSVLWWAVARWRCRFARVQCADMWAGDWSQYHMVYVFQRPENMAALWRKACEQMPVGAWFVSLQFPAPKVAKTALVHQWATEDGRVLWVYRVPAAGGLDGTTLPCLFGKPL